MTLDQHRAMVLSKKSRDKIMTGEIKKYNDVVHMSKAIGQKLIDILHYARTQNIVIALILHVLELMLRQYHKHTILLSMFYKMYSHKTGLKKPLTKKCYSVILMIKKVIPITIHQTSTNDESHIEIAKSITKVTKSVTCQKSSSGQIFQPDM